MNEETILLRQAHPSFMDGDQITSQVFYPFPKDNGKLSVYDGDQITPADSHQHYTGVQSLQSAGVWAVTKQEADIEGVPAAPDPLENFEAHACLDFSGQPEKSCRKIAKRLKSLAAQRGCLYKLK